MKVKHLRKPDGSLRPIGIACIMWCIVRSRAQRGFALGHWRLQYVLRQAFRNSKSFGHIVEDFTKAFDTVYPMQVMALQDHGAPKGAI